MGIMFQIVVGALKTLSGVCTTKKRNLKHIQPFNSYETTPRDIFESKY